MAEAFAGWIDSDGIFREFDPQMQHIGGPLPMDRLDESIDFFEVMKEEGWLAVRFRPSIKTLHVAGFRKDIGSQRQRETIEALLVSEQIPRVQFILYDAKDKRIIDTTPEEFFELGIDRLAHRERMIRGASVPVLKRRPEVRVRPHQRRR